MLMIFSANIINMIFNVLTNFLLPKYLSVESYSAIKTYQLYLTYAGIFSLGCADGMYLKYGGRSMDTIDMTDLKTDLFSYRSLMITVNIVMLAIAIPAHDKVLLGFVYTIFFTNMMNYFKNLYRAIGEFDRYGRIINITTILMFAVNMILLFAVRSDNYYYYLIGYAIINMFVWILLEYNSYGAMKAAGKARISIPIIVSNIRSGFSLMIGNFSNILLSSMDRWFVKMMMDTAQFAAYSFAVSLEGFLFVATTPITVTLYNYFCNHREEEDVAKVRKYVFIFATIIIAIAYPGKLIVQYFLPKYTGSIQVMFILFGAEVFYSVIKGVYVNLYEAEKKQTLYFIRLAAVLVIGAILNYVFVKIYPQKEAFSYGTLLSGFIWLMMCIYDFNKYSFPLKELIFSTIMISCFVITGINCGAVVGFIIYVTAWLFMDRALLWKETTELCRLVRSSIHDKTLR